jgi:hypothetical protein
MPPDPAQPDESRKRDDADDEDRHVLPRDSQDVGEARLPERLPQRLVDALVGAEHDAEQQRPLLPFGARREDPLELRAQPVGDATDPAPPADDAPVAATEHQVDALSRQPATLIEAGLGPTRLGEPRPELEDRPLWRRPLSPQLEQHPLPHRVPVPAAYLGGGAHGEARAPRRRGDDDVRRRGAAQERLERAAVERVEPQRAPPGARRGERECEQRQAGLRRDRGRGEGEKARRGRGSQQWLRSPGVGARQPERRGAGEERRPLTRRGAPERAAARGRRTVHGVTASRSCSTREGPMPGTESRSSTERKGPCAVRQSTIF